ncbi:MAG TPA: cation diffusion facilitator family transporter [Bryobacterales bacterium]|nr:cation diffusion facilitator family transporter [Bryobacterales bacterium]
MHSHAHTTGRKLQLSLWATVVFIIIEFAAGIKAQSLALLSDAGHNFTDALALGLAWFAFYVQAKPPSETKTFGYHRAGVLSAFVNALALVVLALWIFYESYERFLNPRVVDEDIMLVVAAAGLVVNVAIMWALHAESRDDINIRGAFMHMLGDALGSVGIIVGSIVITLTGSLWVDPLLSVLIGVLILWSGWDIIRESIHILLEGLPRGMKFDEVCGGLRSIDGVIDVHDMHIWSLSSNSHALSCHAVIEDIPPSASDAILHRMNHLLADRFAIHHTTIQFEHVECEHSGEICSNRREMAGAHHH